MKEIIKSFFAVCESFGKARAAAYYSRMGRHDLARDIILRD
jgi:uncharacterized protein (UPF0262 family)